LVTSELSDYYCCDVQSTGSVVPILNAAVAETDIPTVDISTTLHDNKQSVLGIQTTPQHNNATEHQHSSTPNKKSRPTKKPQNQVTLKRKIASGSSSSA
jgi:hypothetical protein